MQRVFLNQLRSKKQLRKIDCTKVVSAGFCDDTERHFEITFDVGGEKMIDLAILFETRTPRIFISSPYKVN